MALQSALRPTSSLPVENPGAADHRSRRPLVAALALTTAIVAASAAGIFISQAPGPRPVEQVVVDRGPVNANQREGRVPAGQAQPQINENKVNRESRIPVGP